jgi:branched-chain amino acid transport system permease protein
VDKFLIFTIVGLSTAAIYAVIASGLVLTYTTTGVFNFAHGAAGMLAAFAYWQLRVDWDWPAPLALAAVLLVLAPGFGLLLERVIMRGLEGTSEATKLVVSISLLVGMIGVAQWVWPPGVSRTVRAFFGSSKFTVGPTVVTYHQLVTIGVAIAVAIGLRLLLYRSRTGVAMRAVVDDRSLAQLNGARTALVARASWAIGTSLAALGGILIVSSSGLSAPALSLLIVNAYAAAVFGRLRSIPLTFLGAVVLGCLEGYLTGYLPQNQYLPGLRLAAPVILLFVVLLVMPNPSLRSHVRTREYFPAPTRKGAAMFLLFTLGFGLVLATTLSRSDLTTYAKMFSIGIVALSLVPLVGFAGQISLCQLSFAGIGAICMAHYGADGSPTGVLVAVVVCAAVGALVALPALRLSGIYLALATAAFAVFLDRWVFNLPDFSVGPVDIKFFGSGSVPVKPLKLFGTSLGDARSQMVLAVIAFVLIAGLVMGIRSSRFGRRLLAVRDSEAACATFGLNLLGARLAVFMLSAAIAGLGGAIYATELSAITPNNFDFFTGLPIFMLVVVGGAGFVGGALFAGIGLYGVLPAVTALWEALTRVQTVTTGLVGISMGKQPSGAAPQFTEGFAELRDDTPVLVSMVVGVGIAWVLRLAGVYEGWGMVIVMFVVAVAALGVARRRAERSMGSALEAGEVPVEDVPLEWMGVTVPWSVDKLTEIDRHLYLQEFNFGSRSGAGSSVPGPERSGGAPGSTDDVASREVARAAP